MITAASSTAATITAGLAPVLPTPGPNNSNTPTFGPAFLSGGGASASNSILYNSLGRLLNDQNAPLSPTALSSTKRREQLEAAADKMDSGDLKGARDDLEALLKSNANDITAIHLTGHSHLLAGEYEQAEEYFARASALAPGSARIRSDLENARSLQNGDNEVVFAARKKLNNPTTRADALRLLIHLTDRSPDNVDAYLALADGYDAARQPVQVIGAIQEAVRLADNETIDDVIKRARKLATGHPNVGMPFNILGRSLLKAGRTDEAIRNLQTAVDIAGDNTAYQKDLAGGYVDRARNQVARGDLVSAEITLKTARRLDAANTDADEVMARIAAARATQDIAAGRFRTAYKRLRTARAHAPDEDKFRTQVASAFRLVGAHYLQQGDDAFALAAYSEAHTLNPASSVVRQRVGELSYSQGQAELAINNFDTAIEHLERAAESDPSNDGYRENLATAHDDRGQFRIALGDLAQAIDDFKIAFHLDPSNASIDVHLSTALAEFSGH